MNKNEYIKLLEIALDKALDIVWSASDILGKKYNDQYDALFKANEEVNNFKEKNKKK